MAKAFRQKLKNSAFFWFLLILLIASFLRLWQVSRIPPGPFGDELDVGYHAYSILKTGKDYYGQFLPTYIHSLAEWRAPLFIYSAVPFIGIFGLNELGVRAAAVFFGILGIFLLYLLTVEIFQNRKFALLAALFLAISPWHLHYSRAAFEVTLLLSLFLGGALFFLKGLKKPFLLVVAALLLALTPYTYSTANLFLPFLLLSLFLIFKKEIFKIGKKWLAISFITAFIILLPFVVNLVSGQATHRFSKISIFADEKLIDEINLKRDKGGNIERIFHNKVTAYGKTFATNYLTAFSPQFLFLSGDPNPRQGIRSMGELYLIFLPLFLIGIWVGLKDIGKKSSQLVFAWLLISPIPAALTQGGSSHATRLFLMLPPLIILVAWGFLYLFQIKNKLLKATCVFLVLLFLVVETMFYFHQYYIHYSKESWRWWQYGYKETMIYIGQHQNEYDQIFINNTYEPSLVRLLFWTKYEPARFHQEFTRDEAQENILPGFDGFRVDKFYFGNLNKEGSLEKLLTPGTLYLVSQEDEVPGDWDWRQSPPPSIKVLMTTTDPYNQPLFYLVTGK